MCSDFVVYCPLGRVEVLEKFRNMAKKHGENNRDYRF